MDKESIFAEIDWASVIDSSKINLDTWVGIISGFKPFYLGTILEKVLEGASSDVPPQHLRAAKDVEAVQKILQEEIKNERLWAEENEFGDKRYITQEVCARAHDRNIKDLCWK
ncbi:MAG: hypothetical protein IID17_06685, partial [Nitrospinae bacterium]|nr:hypothetical protein [Nitrospinota bacterium]